MKLIKTYLTSLLAGLLVAVLFIITLTIFGCLRPAMAVEQPNLIEQCANEGGVWNSHYNACLDPPITAEQQLEAERYIAIKQFEMREKYGEEKIHR
ncbi:hypothetical protein A4G18_00615 [Pasteurellaceae bacterium Pebbles2]|nr:hypothetical protein [Pasteurellaceae bacterium Pebbles2]